MSDCTTKNTTTGIIIFAAAFGALTALNAGLLFHFYRKCRNLAKTLSKLEEEKNAEIGALKTTLFSLQQSAKAITAASTSDSDYQDAVEEPIWENHVEKSLEPASETTSLCSEQNFPVDQMKDKPVISFVQLDKLYDSGSFDELYVELHKIHKEHNQKGKDEQVEDGVQILWRLSRACYQMATNLDSGDRKKDLLEEGYKHGGFAYEKAPEEFEVIKWFAACTGGRTDFLGTSDKIKQGHRFKELIDKALAKNPNDYALLHMRGRFSFSVAGLSWIERKMAATFFAAPPTATYDDAIQDFLTVYGLKPDWVENTLFLAKSYLAKKERGEAVKYLTNIVNKAADKPNSTTNTSGSSTSSADNSASSVDLEDLKEAKELLKKYKS